MFQFAKLVTHFQTEFRFPFQFFCCQTGICVHRGCVTFTAWAYLVCDRFATSLFHRFDYFQDGIASPSSEVVGLTEMNKMMLPIRVFNCFHFNHWVQCSELARRTKVWTCVMRIWSTNRFQIQFNKTKYNCPLQSRKKAKGISRVCLGFRKTLHDLQSTMTSTVPSSELDSWIGFSMKQNVFNAVRSWIWRSRG